MNGQQAAGLTWACGVEPPDWLVVPRIADDAWTEWASEIVRESMATGPDVGPQLDSNDLASLADDALDRLVEFAGAVPASDRVVAAVGVAGRTPVPIHVTVAVNNPANPSDLLAACGATGGDPIDPPSIEYPDIDEGDALRVIRVDRDELGQVWISVALARRTCAADTLLVWRTTDLGLVANMVDRIDELLSAIKIEIAA